MEHAYWIDWRKDIGAVVSGSRVYLGHETCQHLMPTFRQANKLANILKDHDIKVTLVTPFLTNDGLTGVCRLIDHLLGMFCEMEVVCSDWGLVHYLCSHKLCIPVIGRLLSAQPADPRIIRILENQTERAVPREAINLDGRVCTVFRRQPSPALSRHYQGCWLDKADLIAFFTGLGLHRCEISNVAQGIELTPVPQWSYSLHTPEVLVAVMRECPGDGEDFNYPKSCSPGRCSGSEISWRSSVVPVDLFRRDNALYYRWANLPDRIDSIPIDRMVHHKCP
jgi:hypothetical protein